MIGEKPRTPQQLKAIYQAMDIEDRQIWGMPICRHCGQRHLPTQEYNDLPYYERLDDHEPHKGLKHVAEQHLKNCPKKPNESQS